MLIRKITIQNFLCYYGTDNQFTFTEGLNIVLGANGYGKSKLYDAFQWVFSDGITDNSPRATAGGLKLTSLVKGNLVSEKAKAHCAVGESVETKVIVEVESSGDGASKKYQLIRTYRIRRSDEKVWVEPGKSEFQLLESAVLYFKPVPESQHKDIMERLIPVDVQPYVWFQGERGISNLIDTSNTTSLRNVIKRLSDIDRWDKYIKVTEAAYNTVRSQFDQALKTDQKNQLKISELQTEDRKLGEQIIGLDLQITSALQNQQAAQEKSNSLLASIEFAERINRLIQGRDQAEKAFRVVEKQSNTFEETLSRKLFTDNWILLDTEPLLGKFEDKLTAYDDAVALRKAKANLTKQMSEKLQIRLPDNVPEPMYVRKMLQEEHCKVCDRPAPQDSEAYQAIASLLLPESEIVQPEQPRTNLKSFFRQLLHNGLAVKSSIETINIRVQRSMAEQATTRAQVQQADEELDAKIRELQEQEQLSGLTNARDIVNSMNGAIADITRYGEQLARFRSQKEEKSKQQRDINDKLIDISKGQIPDYLTQKKTILADVAELAKRVRKNKYQELVLQLESTANEHYRNINAPTGAFAGAIRFFETPDGGYQPIIFDGDHEASNPNTSLVSSMKLSIIMAIVSANKTRNYASFYPLISDAPVSDFDAEKIPAFFKETANTFKQSIIIMKEWLIKDPQRVNRYKPDLDRLRELSEAISETGKSLNVYQLDMPDDVINAYRSELEITIQKIDC